MSPEFATPEFRCLRCGNCCRGEGYVLLSPAEIARIAAHLGLPEPEFLRQYTATQADGEVHLLNQGDALQTCIFLDDANACRIHPVKPDQCEGFPTVWRPPDVADYCAGVRLLLGLPPPTRRTISDKGRAGGVQG